MIMDKEAPGNRKPMLPFVGTDKLRSVGPAGISDIDAEFFERLMVDLFRQPGKKGIVRAVAIQKKSLGKRKKIFLETAPGELSAQIGKLSDAPLGILLHFLNTAVYRGFYEITGELFRFQ